MLSYLGMLSHRPTQEMLETHMPLLRALWTCDDVPVLVLLLEATWPRGHDCTIGIIAGGA